MPGLKDVETLRKEADLAGISHRPAAEKKDPAVIFYHLAATPPPANGEVKKGYDPRRNGHRPPHPAVEEEALIEVYG